MESKKFRYRLMAAGLQSAVMIFGTKHTLNPPWHVPLYSEEKIMYAKDEEDALGKIREKIASSGKWTGFYFIGNKAR